MRCRLLHHVFLAWNSSVILPAFKFSKGLEEKLSLRWHWAVQLAGARLREPYPCCRHHHFYSHFESFFILKGFEFSQWLQSKVSQMGCREILWIWLLPRAAPLKVVDLSCPWAINTSAHISEYSCHIICCWHTNDSCWQGLMESSSLRHFVDREVRFIKHFALPNNIDSDNIRTQASIGI